MKTSIDIKPEILRWAIERSGLKIDDSAPEILQLAKEWINRTKTPTLKKLEAFAKKVMVPLGYLFLDTPPVEKLPVADFRTFNDKLPRRPSPNLIDTLHEMQARQEWMRDEAIENGIPPISFVGAVSETASVKEAAIQIKNYLELSDEWTKGCKNTDEIFWKLRNAADDIGILVFLNGIVGANTHRSLDHEEFRGFVLVDKYAPLVFINSNDTKTAKLFTLAHELVHLAMGKAGLFNLRNLEAGQKASEIRCNEIAAEMLVPSEVFSEQWKADDSFDNLAKYFGVSKLVIARRALDHHFISRDQFFSFYQKNRNQWEQQKEQKKAEGRSGGDFYTTTNSRLSRRFVLAVFSAVGAGELLHRDAYNLMGLRGRTFENFKQKIKENRNE